MDEEILVKIYYALPYGVNEYLWAKSLGDDLYEVRSIPFWVPGLNYEDVVRTIPSASNQPPRIREVVRRSGHKTLRIDFESSDHAQQQQILSELVVMHARFANLTGDDDFYAVDTPSQNHYLPVYNYLKQLEQQRVLRCIVETE
jgi:hypothetical protein